MSGNEKARPDAGSVQGAIDRYRDLAKYLIGIFAAIGALLVAGTQLSSIGELSWEDDSARLVACVLGLLIALVAVVWIARRAVDVLRPVDLTLEEVNRDDGLRTAIESEPGLLGGAQRIALLAALTTSSVNSPTERARWRKIAASVVDRAAYVEMRRRFDRAWREMLIAAAVGAVGITVLAWAANPKDEDKDKAGPTVSPVPVPVLISLTDNGRSALGEAVGEACPEPIAALALGGSTTHPLVVTTAAGRRCKPSQFVLAPSWGHARGTAAAAAGMSANSTKR